MYEENAENADISFYNVEALFSMRRYKAASARDHSTCASNNLYIRCCQIAWFHRECFEYIKVVGLLS